MKCVVALLVLIVCVGCTQGRVIDFDSEEINKHQIVPEIFKIGDIVTVNTIDGKSERFQVKAVSEEMVDGENISIPISNIVSVEKVEATPLAWMCALPIGFAIGWLYMAIPVALVTAFSGL